jgi:hypothetical protein
MAITYTSLLQRVARLISDPDVSIYDEGLYYDAICAAHDAVLPWLPNYCTAEATSGSWIGYKLPDDAYDVQSVKIGTGNFIPKSTLASGTNRPTSLTACDWIETPKGYLSLSASDITDPVYVNYLGYWPKPPQTGNAQFPIAVPACGHQGMVFYAASLVVTPVIVDISTLGPFKLRVESGTPEDNPMMRTSEWFRQLFLQEMKMMPPYQKAKA